MLEILYDIRCSIVFEHHFYSEGICTDIRLTPTGDTIQALEDHGLLVKNTLGKTHIFQQISAGVPEVPFTEPVCFSFMASLTNSAIYNLFDTGGIRQFHLTNLNSDGTFRDTLTQDEYLSQHEILPRITPQKFNFELRKGAISKLVIDFFDSTGWNTVTTENIDPKAEGIELTFIKPGKYRITKQPLPAGETSLILIASDDAYKSTPFFALIDIWLQNDIAFKTLYTAKIPGRLFKFQYIFTDVESKQINYDIPIIVRGKKHILDTISAESDIAFSELEIADPPESKIDIVVAQLKKTGSDRIYVVESVSPLPVLENRPASVKLKAGANEVILPVPLLNDLQIIDNKAVVFFNI
ncbi:hypothetical protein GCM10010967_56820 [Dyadobacter beijingensis]|uniref:Uncharacterized protein n=1 Tax=Dyadobacter beijingensis TaxID=365489 RepID=A0ABQ2IN25_9BACT|nr:hypothetical protein [Dyadobacter beijingensis]GGN13327.1 hypothetical protein GCM10010967_56820 [Dyadobacter beijingensis]